MPPSSEPLARAVVRTSARPLASSPVDAARHGLRGDMSGSALPLLLLRGCNVRLVLRPVLLLPPQRLSTPRLAGDLSIPGWGLVPGGPAVTGTGLTFDDPVQLAGRKARNTQK